MSLVPNNFYYKESRAIHDYQMKCAKIFCEAYISSTGDHLLASLPECM